MTAAPEEVEAEAQALAPARSYLEPFALRALGIVREDEALVARAHEAFQAMRLDWYADQTERLRSLRKHALG